MSADAVATPVVNGAVEKEEPVVAPAEAITATEPAPVSDAAAVAPTHAVEEDAIKVQGESSAPAVAPIPVPAPEAEAGKTEEGKIVEGAAADTPATPPKDKKAKPQGKGLFSRLTHFLSGDEGSEKAAKSPKKEKKVKTPKAEKTQAAAEAPAESTEAPVAEAAAAPETGETPAAETVEAVKPIEAAAAVEPSKPVPEGPAAEVPATAATTDAPKTETKDEIKPKINRRLSARIGQYITKVIKKDHPAEAKPAAPVAGEGAETTEGAEAAKEDVAPVLDAPATIAPLGEVIESQPEAPKEAPPAAAPQVAATA